MGSEMCIRDSGESDLPRGHKNLRKAILDASLTYRKFTAGEAIESPASPFQRAGRFTAAIFRKKPTVKQ